jgi:lipopolysaccharide biosynthesis glycosyltransferase
MNYINVAYAFYNHYYYITHVSMKSIMLSQKSNTFINFYILIHENAYNKSKPVIDKISQEHSNCKIKYFLLKDEFKEFKGSYWTTAAFYRLIIQNFLINETKCLYFDCDTLIYKDLNEIYSYNITDKYYIGGYEGYSLIKYGRILYNNINSGVLLINLEKLRNDNVLEKIINFLRNYNEVLTFPDQEAINVVCNKNNGMFPSYFISSGICDLEKIKAINEKKEFQNMTKKYFRPYIFHFRVYKKPWLGIAEGKNKLICFDFLSRFHEAARKTSYYFEILEKYAIFKK